LAVTHDAHDGDKSFADEVTVGIEHFVRAGGHAVAVIGAVAPSSACCRR
jgi:hypothetical protein